MRMININTSLPSKNTRTFLPKFSYAWDGTSDILGSNIDKGLQDDDEESLGYVR